MHNCKFSSTSNDCHRCLLLCIIAMTPTIFSSTKSWDALKYKNLFDKFGFKKAYLKNKK